MINSNVDWSRPLSWAVAAALVLLLVWQGGLLIRTPSPPGIRRAIRIGLNMLLWLVLAAYVLQPVWYDAAPATHVLLVSDEIPADRAREVQATLGLKKRFTVRNFAGHFATVTLLGQAFPAALLSRLSESELHWMPDTQPNQLQAIHWDGITRQGALQRVSGRIQSSGNQWLRLRYAGQTLDSVRLAAGSKPFSLQSPVFTRGRTQFDLLLNDLPLDTIRFFARPAETMAYQFILDNPDFETKTLAGWLGRMGQSVQLTSTVSTNIRNSLTINQAKPRTPDVLITDPGNAANAVVKQAVAAGKRVLFINLTNPEADIRTINQALGTRFGVRKLTNAESVPVGKELTALPYQFTPSLNQQLVPGYPAAVQRTIGLTGISLLNETFPLVLSGDSVAYARLWSALLAPVQTPGRNNVAVDAPVFGGLSGTIRLNNAAAKTTLMRIGGDTARLRPSPINPLLAEGTYRFGQAGWVPIADSLAVFVSQVPGSSVGENRLVNAYIRAHRSQPVRGGTSAPPAGSMITEWVWFVLFMGCFAALWVEPKLG